MYTLIGTLLVLGIAIIVHELGHFIAARRSGVRVEEFCIGFPPRIFSVRRGETQYSIGILPLGGFVKMAGEDPEAVTGAPDEFFSQSIPARIRIALAGPFGNFICAYFCVLIYLWTGGVQESLRPPVLGIPETAGAYEAAGVRPGDRIIDVDGTPTQKFSDFFRLMAAPGSRPVRMTVVRGGETLSLSMDTAVAAALEQEVVPMIEPVIANVLARSPAAKAGLASGDRVTDVNGVPISEWAELQRTVSAMGGETVVMGVMRGTTYIPVTVVPDIQRQQTPQGEMEKVGRIGVQSGVNLEPVRFGFLDGLWQALKMVWGFILLFFSLIWQLFTGGLSPKLLGGPIGIAQVAGESLRQGGHHFLMFLGMINANLGFVNLIPFFLVTDGGLIVLFLIEAIRRKKMSLQGLERWTKVGWAMVLSLLIMATYNDLVIRLELGDKICRGIDHMKNYF